MLDKQPQIEQLKPLLRKVIEILGEDPDREGLKRTPERWAEALLTYTEGTHQVPQQHLQVMYQLDDEYYPSDSDDMVIIDNIEFVSTCEHHIAPFRGVAHVAYIPNPNTRMIVGLSKVSRVVDLLSQRLQVQERLTRELAQAIYEHLGANGVIVVLQAVHYCMIQRGVKQRSSTTTTTARFGDFLRNPVLETKFQEYLRIRNHDLG